MCANIFLSVGLFDFPYLILNSVMTLYKPTSFKLGTEIVFNWIRGWYHIIYLVALHTLHYFIFYIILHTLYVYMCYTALLSKQTAHSIPQTTYQWVFLQQNHQNFSPVQQSRNPTIIFYRSHTNMVLKKSLFTSTCINHFLVYHKM